MKTYRKPRAFTRKNATCKVLRMYAARNKAEQHIGSFKSEAANIAKRIRARLVAETPSASNAEIDAKLNRIMSGGTRPTKDKVPEPLGVPKDVQSARRAERRKRVRGGRTSRK
jgi:hypothetical protein